VSDPTRAPETVPLDDVVDEMRARLEAEGPMTLEQLGATKGNAKRAYEQLKAAGEAIEVGKDGRKRLYGLAGLHDDPQLVETNAVKPDRTRDRVREKPNNGKASNAVKARPRSDRNGTSGPDAVGALPSADRSSVPPTVAELSERGQRSDIYSDLDRDRVRSDTTAKGEYEA